MSLQKRVKSAWLFENGNLAACDIDGQQITELQGAYSIDKHKQILLEATDDCEFHGFHILPEGFIKHSRDYADYFREKNMSMEDIKNL